MGYYSIDSAAAHAVLVRWSQATNIKLSRISDRVVEFAAKPGDEPYASLRRLIESLSATPPRLPEL
jgi:hypothetical protein